MHQDEIQAQIPPEESDRLWTFLYSLYLSVAIAQLENRSRGNSRTKPKPITDRVENIPASTVAVRWVIDGSGTYPVLTLFFLHIFVS